METRILVGLIGIPLGFVILKYRTVVKDWMGNIAWAERFFGQGGTWTALTLIGLGMSIFSFLFMIGQFQLFFMRFFGRFF